MEDKLKIHVLHTGNVEVDEALPFGNKSKNPLAYTGIFRTDEHKIKLPVSAYLIEHPRGNVLVDTGWSKEVRNDYKKHLPLKGYIASRPILPKGQNIAEQLDNLNIYNIQFLLFTHMHVDHIDGLYDIEKRVEFILVSKEEYETAKQGGSRYVKELWDKAIFDPFAWNGTLGPYFKSYDLFKDGKINLIYLPGHSNGSTGVLIKNNGKFVLLTGDCGYGKFSWQDLELPGIVNDKDRILRSLRWIQKLSKSNNCVEILATHDVDVKPHTIEF